MMIAVSMAIPALPRVVAALPAFDPLTAFGAALVAWYDASASGTLWQDAGVTPAGPADPVGQWDDRTAALNHLSMAGAARPVRNGTSIAFGGANKITRAVIAQGNQAPPYSVACVGAATANSATYYDNGASTTRNLVQRSAASTTLVSFAGASLTATSQPDLATRRAILCEYNGASSSIRVNNGTAVSGNAGSNALGALNIGGNSSNLLVGELNELLFINRLLTSQERTDLQTYLAAKWSL